mmetsp:Transcript_9980/g.26666  ORF Transcript_9980/g.26666 Transcript_9980/m.26666 type:complete len:352 (+) Transcript_9980:173-1228(+)
MGSAARREDEEGPCWRSPLSPRGSETGAPAECPQPRCLSRRQTSPRLSRSVASLSSTWSVPNEVWPWSSINHSVTSSRMANPISTSIGGASPSRSCRPPERETASDSGRASLAGTPRPTATVSSASSQIREMIVAVTETVMTSIRDWPWPCSPASAQQGSTRRKKPASDDSCSSLTTVLATSGRRQRLSRARSITRRAGKICSWRQRASASSSRLLRPPPGAVCSGGTAMVVKMSKSPLVCMLMSLSTRRSWKVRHRKRAALRRQASGLAELWSPSMRCNSFSPLYASCSLCAWCGRMKSSPVAATKSAGEKDLHTWSAACRSAMSKPAFDWMTLRTTARTAWTIQAGTLA